LIIDDGILLLFQEIKNILSYIAVSEAIWNEAATVATSMECCRLWNKSERIEADLSGPINS
jgi:hypothetical protein